MPRRMNYKKVLSQVQRRGILLDSYVSEVRHAVSGSDALADALQNECGQPVSCDERRLFAAALVRMALVARWMPTKEQIWLDWLIIIVREWLRHHGVAVGLAYKDAALTVIDTPLSRCLTAGWSALPPNVRSKTSNALVARARRLRTVPSNHLGAMMLLGSLAADGEKFIPLKDRFADGECAQVTKMAIDFFVERMPRREKWAQGPKR